MPAFSEPRRLGPRPSGVDTIGGYAAMAPDAFRRNQTGSEADVAAKRRAQASGRMSGRWLDGRETRASVGHNDTAADDLKAVMMRHAY